MPHIFVEHHKGLRLPRARDLPPFPDEFEPSADTSVISCRINNEMRKIVLREFDATRRLPRLPSRDVHCHALQTDSPLAPLWFWDIAHRLEVGASLTITGDDSKTSYLRRPYYNHAFQVTEEAPERLVLVKAMSLPAETCRGLGGWSFCIPVGPDDATHLNACVARILDLGITNFEILLCGIPGPNFRFRDCVRIVGQDLPSHPVRLGLKKNLLATEASYPNLCILHDRVFLPSDFRRAVEAYGDLYPLVTFQSLYFDDHWNLDARRYSDINRIFRPIERVPKSIDIGGTSTTFSSQTLASLELSGFAAAHPRRHDLDSCYVTGSLYLVKRSVWLACPQSPDIPWTHFEDVEHGLRAARDGIPSAINPNAITQSISQRPILSYGGQVPIQTLAGRLRMCRSPFLPLPIPRKPLLRQSAARATRNLRIMLSRYCQGVADLSWATVTPMTTGRTRLTIIAKLVAAIEIPMREEACKAMLQDYERLVLGDMFPFHRVDNLLREFRDRRGAALSLLFDNPEMHSQLAQRPDRSIFADSPLLAFPVRGLALWFGSLVTAVRLGLTGRTYFAFNGGIRSLWRAILDTTPRAASGDNA